MNLFDFWQMSMNGLTEDSHKKSTSKKIYPLVILMVGVLFLYFWLLN